MSRSNILMLGFGSMLAVALTFIVYALNHPEKFIYVPYIGTKGIYTIYVLIMLLLFVISVVLKIKKK